MTPFVHHVSVSPVHSSNVASSANVNAVLPAAVIAADANSSFGLPVTILPSGGAMAAIPAAVSGSSTSAASSFADANSSVSLPVASVPSGECVEATAAVMSVPSTSLASIAADVTSSIGFPLAAVPSANVAPAVPAAVPGPSASTVAIAAAVDVRETSTTPSTTCSQASTTCYEDFSMKDYVHLEEARREKFWKVAPAGVTARIRQEMLLLPEQNKARVQALQKGWIM